MKLPKQLASVDRKVNKLASVPAGAKVGPSQWPTYYNPWLERIMEIAEAV